MRVTIEELKDLTKFDAEELEDFRDDAVVSIHALKQKLIRLPAKYFDDARARLVSAKLAYGTVHQVTMAEVGRRRRKERLERTKEIERAFMVSARERLPGDVFDDLLADAEGVVRNHE